MILILAALLILFGLFVTLRTRGIYYLVAIAATVTLILISLVVSGRRWF